MKVSELQPKQKAELQKRYKEAGLKGPIHLLTVEKVEEKIANALTNEIAEAPQEVKELSFETDVFKQVTKKHEDGSEYVAQVPQELEFKSVADLTIEIGGKIPAGQSNQHPHNSFIIKIQSETFIMSADLASKIFKLKV